MTKKDFLFIAKEIRALKQSAWDETRPTISDQEWQAATIVESFMVVNGKKLNPRFNEAEFLKASTL